ncbi:Mechanosensitive ion channel-domain-containing protein [Phakopsora pachyrhizi]|uniref:Mechanosensitive ion channel protein n=1 Tax=Phakopsora pachyrhizi TaxID=170000 RepID=A0AAV0AY04_PHAPC|nr:Mechanosensitive ion channel-domain-containing protein [Phakopsora pachyrhizi]CAH7675285.1 Mechanosensitive ion channel-domain-containing protein [Phakopsora pachyrhizi]
MINYLQYSDQHQSPPHLPSHSHPLDPSPSNDHHPTSASNSYPMKQFDNLHQPIRSYSSHTQVQDLNSPEINSSNNLQSYDKMHKAEPSSSIDRVYSIAQRNIIIRWLFFITPILALLWIPGVIGLCFSEKDFKVAGVKLLYWSIWLSITWLGWWFGLVIGSLVPHLFKHTIGIALSPTFVEKWFGYLSSMRKPIMGIVWSFSTWLSFNLFIIKNNNSSSPNNKKYLNLTLQALFGIYVSSCLLVAEKLLIQIIAGEFHKKSYEDRILKHKASIGFLVTLYRHSHDIGRNDTLDRAYQNNPPPPVKIFKNALKGVKSVAQSTTSVFGTVASEIAGEQILQPNSASSMVLSALTSSNKTKQLARRIYYSFVPTTYRHVMVLGDVIKCFDGNLEGAKDAFNFLDTDENGDCSLKEIEMALLELHKERLALGSSMRDLDSAVGRLDSIFMFFWYIVSLLIIVALLDVSFQTMIASAGTLILGLSWLIGSTAQEILASVIFLFVKHPYDVGDRVDVDGSSYVVKEMHLLYTIFKQTDGKIVQLPHSVLNTKTVTNIRRSGNISETFIWQVEFGTSIEKIERINSRMNEFVKVERRDYMTEFEAFVKEFDGQTSMTLQADIKYKSNWQNGALKAFRRNKWICALKQVMAEEQVFGPDGAGNPNPKSEPQLIQLISPNQDKFMDGLNINDKVGLDIKHQ